MIEQFIRQGNLSEKEVEKLYLETKMYKDKAVQSEVYGNNNSKINKDYRNSFTYFLNVLDYPFTFNTIQSLIIQEYSNTNLNITDIARIQYARYPLGGRFRWHQDIVGQLEKPRGLTFTMNLSNENDYEGGEFVLRTSKDKFMQLNKKRGSYMIFPSFMFHKVNDIINGERESLVTWIHMSKTEIDDMKKHL